MTGESSNCSTLVTAYFWVVLPVEGWCADSRSPVTAGAAPGAPVGVRAVPMPQPAGDGHGGLNGDVLDRNVSGVEHQVLPLQAGHLPGDAAGADGVQMGVEGGDAGGDIEVELVEVDVITAPGEGRCFPIPPFRREDHADDGRGGADGGVVAGNPLRRDEREGACFDRDVDFSMEEVAGSLREVCGDADGGLLGVRGRGEQGGDEDDGKDFGHALFRGLRRDATETRVGARKLRRG